jgi:hypothetical protein
MKRIALAVATSLILTSGVLAVSIGEMAGTCGDDAKEHCDGVGYGDAMQQCLETHYAELTPECQAIIDRLKGGEGVSLF